MIRIGIIGCGRILAAHLRGYQLLREAGVNDFRITAMCARREADARMYVERGQGPPQRPAVSDVPGDPLAVGDVYVSDFQDDVNVQVFTDYRRMISDGAVDAINDFTKHTLHHQIAAYAFQRGKDLLTQKPLAASVAAARRMCEQAEAHDRVFGVFENARNKPATRHLKWLFDDGLCGQLQLIWLGSVGAWWAPDRIVAETAWRHRREEAGGITLDLGVHQANVIRYLAGEVTSIEGRTSVLEPRRFTRDRAGNIIEQIDCDADDTVFASFESERGVVGSLTASWAGHGEKACVGPGTVFYGSKGRVSGDEVTLDDGQRRSLYAEYTARCPVDEQSRHFPLGLTDPFALNQFDWLEAIRHGRQPETSGREGLRDLSVAYAILESHHAGRRVEVDTVLSGELREFQCGIDERSVAF